MFGLDPVVDRFSFLLGLATVAGVSTGCTPASGPVTSPRAVAAADSAIGAAIAREKSIDPRTIPDGTVGVTPFGVTAADTSLHVLGYGLADILITDLSRSSRLRVVDRLRVDALLRELALTATGRVDSATAPRAGRLVGARRMVTGSLVADARGPARLDGRVGDVVTGQVRATTTSRAPIDAILDAEKSLALALFQTLGITLTPAERALVEQRPTRSLAALLAYSRGVRAEGLKDWPRARAEHQAAVRLDPNFGLARDRLALVDRWLTEVASAGPAAGLAPGPNPAGILVVDGINRPTIPEVAGATEPAFRQRLAATLIVIIQLP